MRFLALAPWQALLLGAITAAAILVLYWLKPPPRRVVVASTMLWRRILRERRRGSDTLRWWLSLLLALTIGLSIALALARPEVERISGRARRIAVVVDNSPTMATRSSDGRSRWEHAIDHAHRFLQAGSPGSEFLVTDTSGQVATPSFEDRESTLRTLEQLGVDLGKEPGFPGLELGDAELVFISDGVMVDPAEVPPEALRISVFEPADNVGITAFEIRPLPANPLAYEAYLEVVNVSAEPKEVSILLSGTNQRRHSRSARIGAGETIGQNFDLSSFEGGGIRAAVTASGDSLDADNFAFSYLPAHRRIRALLVTQGNRFLETFLQLDPRVDLARLSPEELQEFGEPTLTDVYIFDRYVTDTAPARPTLLIRPGEAPWLPPNLGEIEAPEVGEWDEEHPLLQFVSLEDLAIDRAARVSIGDAQCVVGSSKTPLVLAAESPTKWIQLSFDLEDSNFPLQAGFPIFLSNALTWLAGEPLALKRSVGTVEIPLSDARITTLDGETVPSHELGGATVFEVSRPGLYTALYNQKRMHVAVNLADPNISDPNRSRFSPEDRLRLADLSTEQHGEGWLGEELWVLLLGAALLLVVLEWWTYHRRMTV